MPGQHVSGNGAQLLSSLEHAMDQISETRSLKYRNVTRARSNKAAREGELYHMGGGYPALGDAVAPFSPYRTSAGRRGPVNYMHSRHLSKRVIVKRPQHSFTTSLTSFIFKPPRSKTDLVRDTVYNSDTKRALNHKKSERRPTRSKHQRQALEFASEPRRLGQQRVFHRMQTSQPP